MVDYTNRPRAAHEPDADARDASDCALVDLYRPQPIQKGQDEAMTTLILLFAFFLPPHQATVTATPPVVTTKLTLATSFYIDEAGTIYTCADQSYALYVQPLGPKQQIAFYYVMPSQQVRSTDKQKYIATCLLVKP